MLLQQIVELLDAELERLHQLRAILADLHEPATVAGTLSPEMLAAVEAELVKAPEPAPVKKSPAPRGTRSTMPRPVAKREQKREQTALRGPIPKGPVVVRADQLAREHVGRQKTRKVQRRPVAEEVQGSLGSMIRKLRLDAPL